MPPFYLGLYIIKSTTQGATGKQIQACIGHLKGGKNLWKEWSHVNCK